MSTFGRHEQEAMKITTDRYVSNTKYFKRAKQQKFNTISPFAIVLFPVDWVFLGSICQEI